MYNFGSPRVGNHQFASQFNKIVPDAFRVVVDGDIVTGVPTTWYGTLVLVLAFYDLAYRYKHVGTEILIDGLNGSGTIIVDPR
jgi:predicted lipase